MERPRVYIDGERKDGVRKVELFARNISGVSMSFRLEDPEAKVITLYGDPSISLRSRTNFHTSTRNFVHDDLYPALILHSGLRDHMTIYSWSLAEIVWAYRRKPLRLVIVRTSSVFVYLHRGVECHTLMWYPLQGNYVQILDAFIPALGTP